MLDPLKPVASSRRGSLVPFAVAWLAFSVFWVVIAYYGGGGAIALFGLPFVAIGVGMLAYGLKPWLAGMKVGKPEVTFSSSAALPGDEITFSQRHVVRRPVEVSRVTAQFLFREVAIYQSGTDSVTVTEDRVIEDASWPARHYEPGETIAAEMALRIPEDAIHTFGSNNNKLVWLVKTRVEIAGWPDAEALYQVRVLPESRR